MSDQSSDTGNKDPYDNMQNSRIMQKFVDGAFQQQQPCEDINMTFSEAKETDYHNLSEFRKIQLQKQSSNTKLDSPRQKMRSNQHVQISALTNPQSKSALADPKGYSHLQREKGVKKQKKKKSSRNQSQNSPRETRQYHQKDTFEQQNFEFNKIGANIDAFPQQMALKFESIQQYQQSNNIMDHMDQSQFEQQQDLNQEDQNMEFNLQNLSSGSLMQSSRAQQMMNNLRTKGQIKLHKGLKKNYQVVTSKQNSQPPSKCSNKVESNNFFNMPKLSVSSSIINSNPNKKQIYKKRSSVGGPSQSNQAAYKVNSNHSIGQIIAGPLQIKVKRKSLVSNNAQIGVIQNQQKTSVNQKRSTSKNQSPIPAQQVPDTFSQMQQLQMNQQQYVRRQTIPNPQVVANQQIIPIDSNLNNVDQNLNNTNQKFIMKQKPTNKQILQGAQQFVNKPNASFKKIRKHSHIKHNSIDRTHIINTNTSKQRNQFNFQNMIPVLKESTSNLIEQPAQQESIISGQQPKRQRSSQKRGTNQAPHTTKNMQGMGVLKKLIQQQNPEQNVLNEDQWDSKTKLTEQLKEQSSLNTVGKIMRSFDENLKKKSLSGNNKSNQNVTVLVNVKKQVKNVKNQKKIKSLSINQQLDFLNPNQVQMKSFHVNEKQDPIMHPNQPEVTNIDETSPINSRSVIYATQDHCNSKINKKDQQKTIQKNMKKLNQNLLNVISPIGQQSNKKFDQTNKTQRASGNTGQPKSESRKVLSANISQNRASQNQALHSQPSNPSGSYGPQNNSGGNSGCGTGGSNPNTGGTNKQLSQNNVSSSAGVSGSKNGSKSQAQQSISGSKGIFKSFDIQQQIKNQGTAQNILGLDLIGSYSMSRKSGGINDDTDLKFSNQSGTLGMKSSSHQLEGVPHNQVAKMTKEQMKQSILLNQQVHHLHQQHLLSSAQQQQVNSNSSQQQSQSNQQQANQQNLINLQKTNNSGSNHDTTGNGKKRSQPSDGADQIGLMQQQLSYGKSVISSQKSKKTNKGGMFQIYSTEDNRSSFTGILKGQKSKKSSGNGGHLNSGSGSGNHYATMNAGLQNKTTSSKNTNTFRKTRRKRETNGQSGEYNNVSKKDNFLDEFSQFEEQFEKNQLRQKVYVNEQRVTQANEMHANIKNNSKENRMQALLGDQFDPKFRAQIIANFSTAQNDKTSPQNQKQSSNITGKFQQNLNDQSNGVQIKANNKKHNTSFINSVSSDRLLVPNLQNQLIVHNIKGLEQLQEEQTPKLNNQNQISDEFDSYMRDFQMVTNKLLVQKEIIDSQRTCQQCVLYQQLYQQSQMQKMMTTTQQQSGTSNSFNQPQINQQLNDDGQYIGTYKGQQYHHIQHNLMTQAQGPGQGKPLASYCPKHQQQILMLENQNQIVSQSKVIIPRGIVNFKKVHSLSTERRNHSLNLVGPQHSLQPQANHQSQITHHQQLNIHNYSQSQPPRQPPQIQNQLNAATAQPNLEDTTVRPSFLIATGGTGDAGGDNNSSNQDDEERQIEQEQNLPGEQQPTRLSVQSQESANNNTFWQSQGTFNQVLGSFLLEPRDQSLMRKKKVIEILKTFQEQEDNVDAVDKKGIQNDSKGANKDNQFIFGEDVINAQRVNQKQKKQPNTPLLQNFQKDPKNLTYQVDKPIIIKQQNRVKKQNPKVQRRRDQQEIDKKVSVNTPDDLIDGNNLMSDLNDFIMGEDQKINQQEEKFMQQSRKNQENILNEMLNQDYCDIDNPFAEKPPSVNPVIMGSLIDEDEKNDDREDNDDFEMFRKDFGRLLENKNRISEVQQEITSNCQVQDLIGNDLIQSNINNQKVVSPRDYLSSYPQQKFQVYPVGGTTSDFPSGSPPHFYEEGQQASSQNLQLQTQIKNIDSIFEVQGSNDTLGQVVHDSKNSKTSDY